MEEFDIIGAIKDKIDIVTLVERYVKLKPAGKNFVGLCPFHNEKTPSFNVSPDIGIFKCFGCGKSGDIFTFLESIENIDFNEAKKKLAKEAGIKISSNNRSISPITQIINWASLYYQRELLKKENSNALEYLNKRGFNKELIQQFEIGYAPGDGEFLKKMTSYKQYSNKTLLESGLFVEKNNTIREKFSKRVLFPIKSVSGTTIGFTGRLLPGNKFGPKYLHTAETSLFKKRFTLYNLSLAKSYIRKEDLCILLEGTTDVISLFKTGIKNAVAPLGTSLTINQLELISKYTNNLLFIFDSDTAGQTALVRAFILATQLNLNSFALNTGNYKDVDEMIQKEPDELKRKLENKVDAFTYLITQKVSTLDLSKLYERNKFRQYTNTLLKEVKDEDTKKYYEAKISSILGDTEINITDETKQYSNRENPRTNIKNNTIYDTFIATIIKDNEKFNSINFTLEAFPNEKMKTLIKSIVNDGISGNELLNRYKGTDLIDYIETLLVKDTTGIDAQKLYKRIYTVYLEERLKNLRIKLAGAEESQNTGQTDALTKEVQDIMDKIKGLKYENNRLR